MSSTHNKLWIEELRRPYWRLVDHWCKQFIPFWCFTCIRIIHRKQTSSKPFIITRMRHVLISQRLDILLSFACAIYFLWEQKLICCCLFSRRMWDCQPKSTKNFFRIYYLVEHRSIPKRFIFTLQCLVNISCTKPNIVTLPICLCCNDIEPKIVWSPVIVQHILIEWSNFFCLIRFLQFHSTIM